MEEFYAIHQLSCFVGHPVAKQIQIFFFPKNWHFLIYFFPFKIKKSFPTFLKFKSISAKVF